MLIIVCLDYTIISGDISRDTCAQLIHSDNKKKFDMPKGFSSELKAVYFRDIDFVEKEKNGVDNSTKSYSSTNPCFAWYFQIVVIQSLG